MQDAELNSLILELTDVLHDLEWWQSGDIGEDAYRKTVEKFKKKWIGTRDEALRERLCKSLDNIKIEVMDR
tara:strand:+ start:36 stop:248 length:213 start_codon:yes stop_codon:yes gene_type:complete